MYLGNSLGDKPFVNGLIEYNLIMNTLGYNMEIKHQTDTVRDDFAGTMVNGKTIIRYNVFCKEQNASTGSNARPNLLVGGFPLTGWGSNDYYEIYGNFFYQNPTEALFQGTGNIMLYENIFVNHIDPSGYRAVYIRDQNGVQPQDVKVFHNTVWAVNSSGGIRIFNPNSGYQQYCYGNAVFAPSPITNFTNMLDNVTDTYANAGNYVLSAAANLASLDLYPQSGQLTGTSTPNSLFQSYTDWNLDFNADSYNWIYRGAYSGCCINNGWQLQLDTMPTHTTPPTFILESSINDFEVIVYPNPSGGALRITYPSGLRITDIELTDIFGKRVAFDFIRNSDQFVIRSGTGIYFLKVKTEKGIIVKKIIKE
jgi:hypothetical protein